MKIAVLLAHGYEEGESLFVVDVLRRAGFTAHTFSITGDRLVTGAQGITAQADKLFSDEIRDYDMIVLPGGMPGAANLRDDSRVIEMVQYFARENKYIGAICAAPIVLHQAGILNGRKMTSYPGEKYESLFTEADYQDKVVVVDGKLITSRGPATTLPFAYEIVKLLGGDSEALKEKMLYPMAKASEF